MKNEIARDEKRGKRSLIILIISAALCYGAAWLGLPEPWPLVIFVTVNTVVNIRI